MFSPSPVRVSLPPPSPELDRLIEGLPPCPAVFLLEVGKGQQPYLTRTGNLRRRAQRLLRYREGPSRLLNLRGIATAVVYWPAPSSLEGVIVLLEQARSRFPSRYRHMLRLRFPSYVRILRENRFPRCIVSRHPGPPNETFGPFLYRTHAEEFLARALDLFSLRRCEEELEPHPSHPGCIYGEMEMCLRPCQSACTGADYRREAISFLEFLATGGESLRAILEAKRCAASENLFFEEAARIHKRLQKIDLCWKPRNDFIRMIADLHGAAVTPSGDPGAVHIWPVIAGQCHPAIPFRLGELAGVSLKAAWAPLAGHPPPGDSQIREELLAVLTRWKHSSWCDGEWVRFDSTASIPARKIINAAKRVVLSWQARNSVSAAPPILQPGE